VVADEDFVVECDLVEDEVVAEAENLILVS
jgi:hypothetical protein